MNLNFIKELLACLVFLKHLFCIDQSLIISVPFVRQRFEHFLGLKFEYF